MFSPDISNTASASNASSSQTTRKNNSFNNSFTNLNSTSTPSQVVQALLSPPSSRYAFDSDVMGNSNNSNNNMTVGNIDLLSPLLVTTQPVTNNNNNNNSDLESSFSKLNLNSAITNSNNSNNNNNNNNASSSISSNKDGISSPPPGYGVENDIPAFQPETELLLENFTNDLKVFSDWIRDLNSEEQKIVIGLFIESITDIDVIEYIKAKLQTFHPNEDIDSNDDGNGNNNNIVGSNKREKMRSGLNGTFSPPLSATSSSIPQHLRPVSPIIPTINTPHSTSSHTNLQSYSNLMNAVNNNNVNPLTLDAVLNNEPNEHIDNSTLFIPAPRRILSPPIMKTGFSNICEPIERPKSAGATSNYYHHAMNGNNSSNNNFNMTPTSMGMNNNGGILLNRGYSENMNNLDIGTKLQQSLNTITNRNMYDGNNINHINNNEERGRNKYSYYHYNNNNTNNKTMNNNLNNNHYIKKQHSNLINVRQNTSTSVPPNNRIRTTQQSNYNDNIDINDEGRKVTPLTGSSNLLTPGSTPMNKDIASDTLLNDIPAWLKTLRLHKYTHKLQHLKWQELVVLNDEQLEELGVATVGARNKLLKSFAYVRSQKDV